MLEIICKIIVLAIVIALVFSIFFKIRKRKKNENKNVEIEPVKKFTPALNVILPPDFDIDEFENISKELYVNMQLYFSNLNYENLKKILSEELYLQFEKQMNHLQKNNKRSIRDNIEFIDFKINDYNELNGELNIKISIGVVEDKYTKIVDDTSEIKKMRYENYYELELIKNTENWVINKLKLIYSHSKKN